ncbi:MAG: LptF/LptG family permease [Candidatus Aminicenantes bacterium]|nr:LptF/LptG family permease [Candidatus Aminicenantes bacterium]
MLKYFDRYILKEVLPPFFMGLSIYSFVFLMDQLLRAPELFIAKGVSLGVTVRLLLYLVPSILAFTVPMSVLMGILAGLSRLSSDSEITAFKTLGIGPFRLLRPLLVFALGGWLLASALTLYLAPYFNYKWDVTLATSVLNKVDLQFNPREFNESMANMVLFIEDIGRDKSWRDVFIHFSDSPDEPRIVLARNARLHIYPEAKRAVIEFIDGVQHSGSLSDPDKYYRVESAARIEQEISAETLFAAYKPEKRMRMKNIRELVLGLQAVKVKFPLLELDRRDIERRNLGKNDLQRLENTTALVDTEHDRRAHLVEIHKKLALPFACWIFVFLGLPLGSSTKKGGRASGFTLSIVIILVYYVCITAGEKTAMDGRISPFLGMWAGNILFGAFSVYLFSRSSRDLPFFAFLLRRPRSLEAGAARLSGVRWPRFSLSFPNILDRYVSRKYLFIAALIFASLLSISIIVTFFDSIGNIYEHHKPMVMLLDYIRYRIPEFIHYGLPVTALMAALLTLGLFTKFNEITAMKACGISVYRVVVPLVLLAVALGGLSFHIQENILPRSNKMAAEVWNRINDAPPRTYSYETRSWVASPSGDRFYHYNYYDPKTSTFNRLSIFDLDLTKWTITRRIFAAKAVLKGDALHLEKGWVREFKDEAQVKYEAWAALDLPPAEGKNLVLSEGKEPAHMTYGELRDYIRRVGSMGFDTVRFRVDLKAKVSFPFVALIMTLIGIPFAFAMGKRGALVGLGTGLAISILYWVTIGVFLNLGYVGFLSPFLAAWGPNLIFGLTGLYLLFRLRT